MCVYRVQLDDDSFVYNLRGVECGYVVLERVVFRNLAGFSTCLPRNPVISTVIHFTGLYCNEVRHRNFSYYFLIVSCELLDTTELRFTHFLK